VAWSDAATDAMEDLPAVSGSDVSLLEDALGIDDAFADPTDSP